MLCLMSSRIAASVEKISALLAHQHLPRVHCRHCGCTENLGRHGTVFKSWWCGLRIKPPKIPGRLQDNYRQLLACISTSIDRPSFVKLSSAAALMATQSMHHPEFRVALPLPFPRCVVSRSILRVGAWRERIAQKLSTAGFLCTCKPDFSNGFSGAFTPLFFVSPLALFLLNINPRLTPCALRFKFGKRWIWSSVRPQGRSSTTSYDKILQ